MSKSSKLNHRSPISLLVVALHLIAIAPLTCTVHLNWPSLVIVCVGHFVVFGFLLHGIESLFYFEEQVVSTRSWIGGVLAFLGIGVGASLLRNWSLDSPSDLLESLHTWATMHENSVSGAWWMLIVYGAISFMVTYCVVGSATWPFIREHYENSENGLALRVPSGRVVISLQLCRGLVATLVMLPWIAARGVYGEDIATWVFLFLTLSMTFAIAPMLTAPADWPRRLRVIHGIEIVVFSMIQSFNWWWLLS